MDSRFVLGRIALLGLVFATPLPAQEKPSFGYTTMPAINISLEPAAGWARLQHPALERRISLRLQDTTLEQALRKISLLSGVEISYSSDVVPLEKLLSVRLENASVSHALRHILRCESLRFLVGPSGNGLDFRMSPCSDLGVSWITLTTAGA